jgi:hypothetical protein
LGAVCGINGGGGGAITGDIGGSPCTPLPVNPALGGGGPGGTLRDCPGISIIHRSLVFLGLRMNRKMGRYLRKRIRILGSIL